MVTEGDEDHRPVTERHYDVLEDDMLARLAKFTARDDRGATAVEYGLLVTLIALVIVTGMGLLAGALNAMFAAAAAAL